MMRPRFLILAVSILGLIFSAGTLAAEEPVPTENANLSESNRPEKTIYGPILSKDPLVRAEIKRLYIELNELDEETQTQLAELAQTMSTETDPDFRYEIQATVALLKEHHLLRSIEFGLEIARLNGDESRVAEFELALDQLLNPEKYRSEAPSETHDRRPPPDTE
jgi:hypothetical protein